MSSTDGDDASGRSYAPSDHAIGPNPLSPVGEVRPYKTIRAALAVARDGRPDWVLLKRGDIWHEGVGAPRNGRSEKEPSVIAAYGEGSRRPQLRLRGKQSGVRFDIHDGFHDVAIVGLEFYAAGKDPDSPEFSPQSAVKSAVGVFISSKHMACGQRLLIEDCCMRFCGASFQVARDRRNSPPAPVTQLVFRRNLVLDNYSRTSHSQGTYAAGICILLEENIYDHNGWLVQEPGNRKDRGGATIFNHNTYFCDCNDVVFRGNMFLRASSIGNKWTANSGPASARNLVMDNNLYVEGEIGISAGGNTPGPLRFKNVNISNNVFFDIGRGRPTLRHLGWGIDVRDWDGGAIAGNLLVQHKMDDVHNVHLLSVEASDETGACRNVRIADNVFCGAPVCFIQNSERLEDITFSRNTLLMPWQERPLIRAEGDLSGCTFSGNVYSSIGPAEHWFGVNGQGLSLDDWTRRTEERGSKAEPTRAPDHPRSIERYMAHLGLEPTFEAFIGEVRKQSRGSWRPELTVAVINDWVRQGFAPLATVPHPVGALETAR
ncbi:MAG: hypothetical protein ACYTG0_08285 [Planctomycetota bacterium]